MGTAFDARNFGVERSMEVLRVPVSALQDVLEPAPIRRATTYCVHRDRRIYLRNLPISPMRRLRADTETHQEFQVQHQEHADMDVPHMQEGSGDPGLRNLYAEMHAGRL